MHSKIALAALLACAEARFGQEQAVASLISGLSDFGQPGQAATLAGASPGVLLAGANPCQQVSLADQIVTQLSNDPTVIAVAKQVITAEKNFNPFVVSIPSVCADPSLPATAELRGVVPLVDPAVGESDVENANSAASRQTPFDANGLSIADIMIAQGFSNFTAVDVAGGNANNGNDADNNTNNNSTSGNDNGDSNNTQNDASSATVACAPAATSTADNGNSNSTGNGVAGGVLQSSIAGLDFGLCVPTMAFLPGLNGRPATEFTFIPQDPLTAEGQQEALNPNIITNRICDQLTNVCEANDAAKSACKDAQAQVQSLGTRDLSTADKWNKLLGFAGVEAGSPTV